MSKSCLTVLLTCLQIVQLLLWWGGLYWTIVALIYDAVLYLIYVEQVKNAERVRLEQIPLPDAPSNQAGESCVLCLN